MYWRTSRRVCVDISQVLLKFHVWFIFGSLCEESLIICFVLQMWFEWELVWTLALSISMPEMAACRCFWLFKPVMKQKEESKSVLSSNSLLFHSASLSFPRHLNLFTACWCSRFPKPFPLRHHITTVQGSNSNLSCFPVFCHVHWSTVKYYKAG